MMRQWTTAVLLTLLVLMPSVVNAQHRIQVGVGGGISAPVGPDRFSDFYSFGSNVHGDIEYVVTEDITAVVHVTYDDFSLEEEEVLRRAGVSTAVGDVSGDRSVFAGQMGLKRQREPTSEFRMYGLLMAGIYDVRSEDIVVQGGEEEYRLSASSGIRPGVTAGGGLGVQLHPNLGLSVRNMFHVVFVEEIMIYWPFQVRLVAQF